MNLNNKMTQAACWLCAAAALVLAAMTSCPGHGSEAAPLAAAGDKYGEYRHYCNLTLGQPLDFQNECSAYMSTVYKNMPGNSGEKERKSNMIFMYCCLGLLSYPVMPGMKHYRQYMNMDFVVDLEKNVKSSKEEVDMANFISNCKNEKRSLTTEHYRNWDSANPAASCPPVPADPAASPTP